MSENKRYTIDELMPKRYPENEPNVRDKYWIHYTSPDKDLITTDFSWPAPYTWGKYVKWFIDIPGAPEEVRPRKYPDEKPEKVGKYIAHDKINDKWFVNEWRGALPSGADYFSWRELVDYFINIPLEEEMEEPTGKLDKIMSLEAKYAIGGAIKYTKNAMTSPLDDEQIADFVSRFMAPYCKDYDFSIEKHTPEIAPCPACQRKCEVGIAVVGDLMPSHDSSKQQVHCMWNLSCGYRGPTADTSEQAIEKHNAIAGKVSHE